MVGEEKNIPGEGTTRRTEMGGGITRRRFLARGSAFVLAAAVTGPGLTVLSGCGGGGGASSEPLTFMQFYGPGGEIEAQSRWFEDLVGSWNDQNEQKVQLRYVPPPEYVGRNRVETSFAAGEGPDIFLNTSTRFLRFFNEDVLVDLTPYMDGEAVDDFYPDLMAPRIVDGKVYALPMEVEPLAMYYGVRAFEEAGLSEADVPTTWEQLLDVAGRLKTPDRFGVTFPVDNSPFQNFNFYPFAWMGGGDAVSPDGNSSALEEPGSIAALELWRTVVEEELAPRTNLGSGGGDVVSNLAAGYCGMQELGIWGVAALEAGAPDFEYGVARLPLPPDGGYTTNTGGWSFVANAQGRNPEAAARFCVWAVGSTDQDCVGRVADWCFEAKSDLAPRRSVQEEADGRGAFEDGPMKVFREEIFPGGRGEPRYPPEVYEPITEAIQACMLDGANPEEQARQTAASIDQFLEGYQGGAIVSR